MNVTASLVRAEDLVHGHREDPTALSAWSIRSLAGLLVEIVSPPASSVLTVAAGLVRDAQQQGEPCAWVSSGESCFFPPDMARCGVDLEHLLVVRVPDVPAAARSTEYLARSSGFGLIVADFTTGTAREVDYRFAARAVRLARAHNTAVVCLTGEACLGSLVAVRAEARRERVAEEEGTGGPPEGVFRTVLQVTKDRRYGPGTVFAETRYGPDGVC